MIEFTQGNLITADVDALVNSVNAVGVMGKGIALQFKKAFPKNFTAYKSACDAGDVKPGRMFVFETQTFVTPKYIINFPTKRHWKGKSRLADIKDGLVTLVQEVAERDIKSIAVPPLGCGNGGLEWAEIWPLIEEAFEAVPNVRVLVYEPSGAPSAEEMVNRTDRPNMTPNRAAIIGLMDSYLVPGYDYLLTFLEVQKLAYFLQESGEGLKLKFVKERYGPYADNLRHVLNTMEGHFTRGFGDGKVGPDTPLELLPGAVDQALAELNNHPDMQKRIKRVRDLMEGFETPYGLELLSSVHWVAVHESKEAGKNVDIAISKVQNWSTRKGRELKPAHLKAAWEQLHEHGWI